MDQTSEAILAFKPVTFHYKNTDTKKAENTPQFGLIAEEVAEVNPDLVVRDTDGKPFTVRYDAVNAMLLNEFLKEHKKVEEQRTNITQLNSKMANQAAIIAQQQKGMEVLTAQLKEQAAQIQKVNAQLEVSKPAAQVASHKQ
jgi:methyl-accepting chemotaxis protein